jgi:hypothetical protein
VTGGANAGSYLANTRGRRGIASPLGAIVAGPTPIERTMQPIAITA